MDARSPVPVNGKHHTITRAERAKRSPFLEAIDAERRREIESDRRLAAWGIVLVCIAMATALVMIAGFLAGRLM